MTTTATAQRDGITVEVAPGGAIRSLHIDPRALRLGGAWLARSIMALVQEANGRAGQAAEQAMRAELGSMSTEDLSVLGLGLPGSAPETPTGSAPETPDVAPTIPWRT